MTLRASEVARDVFAAVVVFATLVGLAFNNGGYFSGSWTVAAVALLWLTALVLMLAAHIELTSLERAWIVLLAGLVGWTALSTWWSLDRSESLLETRRDLVYLAGVVAVLLLATRLSVRGLPVAVWSAVNVVVAYALVRYLFDPGLNAEGSQENLLFRPVGYANALGIFTGFAVILSVAFAARAPTRMLRTIAAASLAPLAAALYLTASRGSAVAVGVGLASMLILDGERHEILGVLTIAAPPCVAVVALATHSALTDETTGTAEAARQGRLVFVAIVVGGAAITIARLVLERTGRSIGRFPGSGRLLMAAAAIGGIALLATRGGEPFNTAFRTAYWHVAWREYAAHPWLGSGAGTFGDYWARYGNQAIAGGALDAHNLYLETLAELGPIGLALLVAMLGVPVVAATRGPRHPYVAAAIGAYVAFLVHAALDWDWEMPAVTLAGLVFAAAIVVADREDGRMTRPLSAWMRGGALALTLGLALFALLAQFKAGLGGAWP